MSDDLYGRAELGGGSSSHLQCSLCGHYSNSHAQKLSHLAASHPGALDDVSVGRLGNILLYQSTARLFHCATCFHTSRDFSKIYVHIISRHCVDGDEEDTHEDAQKTKSISEAEEGEGGDEGGAPQRPDEGEGSRYRCLICGWRNRLKNLIVNHVVKRHDIPKSYASQAIRRDSAVEDEEEAAEGAGLTDELMKEEMEAMGKLFLVTNNRFTCLTCRTCGWKTRSRGYAIRHAVRFHDVERAYRCKECQRSFFLPSRLQQHISSAHRPGRYACPFCCFRSHFIGGFKRHCGRCNARGEEDEEEVEVEERGAAREGEEEVERMEGKEATEGRPKRKRKQRVIEEEELYDSG